MRKLTAIFIMLLLISGQQANAASLDKAAMLSQHGLTKEAKAELIDVIFSKAAS